MTEDSRAATSWSWEVATDAESVHALLCASDVYHATLEAPAPGRQLATTERHVASGNVHLLRREAAAIGMFTLTDAPPHGMDVRVYPPASRPAYLQRLAVDPTWIDQSHLVGLRCIRRALEVARARQADVVRAEANPNLVHVRRLLDILGFRPCGPIVADGPRCKVYLQRPI